MSQSLSVVLLFYLMKSWTSYRSHNHQGSSILCSSLLYESHAFRSGSSFDQSNLFYAGHIFHKDCIFLACHVYHACLYFKQVNYLFELQTWRSPTIFLWGLSADYLLQYILISGVQVRICDGSAYFWRQGGILKAWPLKIRLAFKTLPGLQNSPGDSWD